MILLIICFDIIMTQYLYDRPLKLIFSENFENLEINESRWNFELGNRNG